MEGYGQEIDLYLRRCDLEKMWMMHVGGAYLRSLGVNWVHQNESKCCQSHTIEMSKNVILSPIQGY
jgi:hypothetical protein